ncbi:MAG TPA: hypothetical protein DEF45_26955 [Rhodopirellula sp.]|nr:hypothetical protein [Rhodopirellula sp.]
MVNLSIARINQIKGRKLPQRSSRITTRVLEVTLAFVKRLGCMDDDRFRLEKSKLARVVIA